MVDIQVTIVTGTQGARGADGAAGVAGAGGNASGVSLFEDFLGQAKTAAGVVTYDGVMTLRGSVAGSVGGALDKTYPGGLSGHPGVIALRSGAAADANVNLFMAGSGESSSFVAGDGVITFEMLANFTALNVHGVQRYHSQFGLSPTVDGTVDNNGIAWFEYGEKLDDSAAVNGGKVLCHAFDSSLDSGFTPVALTFAKYKAVINAAGSAVEFFINGASVGTITKDVSNFGATFMANFTKVGGTTARALNIDYVSLAHTLTTPR